MQSWTPDRMPITVPAHQLLVLPLLGRRSSPLPGVALLVGTVLPDLAFIVGGYGLNERSHLGYGPVMMAPLGVMLYVWAEALVLPALRAALPSRARSLCTSRGLVTTPAGWACAIGAVVLGAYSHLLFDGFTHARSWPAVDLYPRLVASALQYVASVVGSVIVVIWAIRRMRTALPDPAAPRWRGGLRALGITTLVGATVGLAIGVAALGWPAHGRDVVLLAMAPTAIGGFVGVTVAAMARR
jgi:hypothetical protein